MKPKQSIILLQMLILFLSFFATSWLYDTWMINGPHGPYRWVGMDFASYWVGVREMFYGVDPYSSASTLKIQQLIYGGIAGMGDDPMLFSYPAWLFLIVAPLALLPYKLAAVIWVGSLLWGFLNLFYKIAATLGNNNFMSQSLWLIGLLVGSLPFLVISVIKGQLGCLSLVALFAAYQLWKQKSFLAGIILAFALIKPTVTVIPVAVFLVWTLSQKNWKLLAGFASCMTVLLTTSFLAVGNWIPSYFGMLEEKVATSILWSMEILEAPWNFLYAGLFIGMLILSLYLSFKKNRAYWLSAAVLAGIALTPMRWIYDLFLGILILADGSSFSPLRSLFSGIAVLSPWLLVLVPVPLRWNVAVLGLPLLWVATVLLLILHKEPRVDERQLAAINANN